MFSHNAEKYTEGLLKAGEIVDKWIPQIIPSGFYT